MSLAQPLEPYLIVYTIQRTWEHMVLLISTK